VAGGSSGASFIEALMDTNLYSIGAYFVDRHPDLVDDVVDQAEQIESLGLEKFAAGQGIGLEAALQMLLTGLAVRYYRAVNG
jgi:hypothetical protein